ncbi:MAG: hypothetical protein ACERLG_07320, partial [Sedimentibacter sp.]
SKVLYKKEKMKLKEKYFGKFMVNFKVVLKDFVASDKYKNYLLKITNDLNEDLNHVIGAYENLTIYLNDQDNIKYKEFIKKEIENKHPGINVIFTTVNSIIGGVILECSEKDFKIDFTINAVLEENESLIMQTLFEALEAGEKID